MDVAWVRIATGFLQGLLRVSGGIIVVPAFKKATNLSIILPGWPKLQQGFAVVSMGVSVWMIVGLFWMT
ncbi:hypothetical protein [Nitrosomonas sp.]|uniref:hypothetical protein n=1 Tax=Nitrosomonas sp. TaxID=42353 RepID=UPI0025F953D6|nr:hypothetical protein [Nitrosomonas sp.]